MMKTKKWNWIPTIKINELHFDKIYPDYKKILDELNANIFSENENSAISEIKVKKKCKKNLIKLI